jgi:hypothetical protein
MKRILLLCLSMVLFSSCGFVTLYQVYTDTYDYSKNNPKKDSPDWMRWESHAATPTMKDYLDSILSRDKENITVMPGLEAKLPKGFTFVKGSQSWTKTFGNKSVYLMDTKIENTALPLFIVNISDEEMEKIVNNKNKKVTFYKDKRETVCWNYIGSVEGPLLSYKIKKIKKDYYALHYNIPIYYKPTKNYIGSNYFFESIINDMSDCKYTVGEESLKEETK